MTPVQQECLEIIQALNKGTYDGWFVPASVMAFIEIESSFDPKAYRAEPRLRDGSYGLMQLLGSTARGLGFAGDLDALFDPEENIPLGMKDLRQSWDFLVSGLGREPTLAEWAMSYNEGVNAVIGGRSDLAYSDKWAAARARWVAEIGEG